MLEIRTDEWDLFMRFIPFLIPLAVIQIGLGIFAVVDLIKKQQTKTLSPVAWIIIALCLNMLGPILYIIFGRSDSAKGDDDI
jgi:hypothetical protein